MTDILSTVEPDDDLTGPYGARRVEIESDAAIARARRSIQRPGTEVEQDIPAVESDFARGGDETTAEQIGGAVADVAKGLLIESTPAVVTGIVDAATEFTENIMQITDPLAQFLESKLPLGEAPSPEEVFGFIRPGDAESVTGRAIQSISQFVTGFIPALRATRALKLGVKAGAAGRVAESALAGSLADVAVIDEAEGRLSDLLQEVPGLANPVTEFLGSDPEDSTAEAKLKQGIEGLALGGLADGLVSGLRFLSKARAARAAKQTGEAEIKKAAADQTTTFSPEALAKLGDPAATLFKITASVRKQAEGFLDQEPGAIPDKAININMARIGGDDDIRELVARTAKLFGKTSKVQSNEQTIKLANDISEDPERLVQLLTRKEGGFTASEATAVRFLLQQSTVELKRLASIARGVEASDMDKFLLERQFAFQGSLIGQVSAAARESGRALQAFRITAEGGAAQERAIRELVSQPRNGISSQQLADMISKIDTPEGLNLFAKQARKATGFDMFLEAWINGLLSGPQTHVVNTTSNALVALWQIPERFLAAGIRNITGGDGVVSSEAVSQAYGLVRGMSEGIRLAGRTLRTGEPSDRFVKIEGTQRRAITARNLNLDDAGIAGRAVDFMGEVVRTPGRALMAEDEFFKAVGYRMELNARAFRTASAEGLEGQDMAKRIQEIIANPPDDIRLAATDAARYQTFTKPLGATGQSVIRIAETMPVLRLITPFIRTPVNIMKFVGERTALAPISAKVRAEVAAGGARRDIALAKISMGSMVMSVASTLAAEGLITGGGPADRNLKSAMRRTGWAAYSIKVGDNFVSFNRLDPLGMLLGIAADFSEIIGYLDEGDAAGAAGAAVLAVSENIISKNYMQGLANVLEIFGQVSPELGVSRGQQFVQKLAGSLVPAVVAQAERTVDPTLRVARTILDEMRSRIPGLSDDLPPQLNLWGDPIVLSGGVGPDIMSPFWVSPLRDSPVDEEMVRNGFGIKMPPRVMSGVELSDEEYGRFVKLAGNELKDPSTGQGARETLEAIIAGRSPLSGLYKQASDGPEGGKALIIKRVIRTFRSAAKAEMISSDPVLRSAVEENALAKARALSPDAEVVQ